MPESVAIVGAGLVGCVAALGLSAKGYDVSVYEMRKDPRTDAASGKNMRSINLAVSDRGIRALHYIDPAMANRVLRNVIPMTGRMIHDATGTKQELQPYGLFGESIKSIDRLLLNHALLDELDRRDIAVHFGHKIVDMSSVSVDAPVTLDFLTAGERRTYTYDYLVAADGAYSQSRYLMQKTMRMDYLQKYVAQQYLELYIPPADSTDAAGGVPCYSLDPNHLHIWPRKEYMLIALANHDGSFTVTFFCTWALIEALDTADAFLTFFRLSFPGAYTLIGEEALRQAHRHQPRGALMQMAVSPFASPNRRSVLIGDSAHSMVPFYGQGMNCGFEDVHVLLKLLDDSDDMKEALARYTPARKDDVDTICRLAYENYRNMSALVLDPLYLLRKKIDYVFGEYANGRLFPWIPMYTMVSFRGDIRYSDAERIEKRQAGILAFLLWAGAGGVAVLAAGFSAHWFRLLSRH